MVYKLAKLIFTLLYFLFLFLVVPLSIWVLFNAKTLVGYSLAVIGIISSLLPLFYSYWWQKPKPLGIWGWTSITLSTVIVVLLALVLLKTPSGKAPANSPVQNHFTNSLSFPTYSFSNIVPEIEQVNLGFRLMSSIDSTMTQERANRVSQFTFNIYREMEADKNFQQLGSVMTWAYTDLLSKTLYTGHYYMYIPRDHSKALPVIVFLHGSLGNFKSYTWVWSKFAEEKGYVIIAPSFGFGKWRLPQSTQVIDEVLTDASKFANIDQSRIYLAGLSNGGLGVCQVVSERPNKFSGLIFISPVTDALLLGSSLPSNKPKPLVLVITGKDDERISLQSVLHFNSSLRELNFNVTEKLYDKQDHFLFFSQYKDVFNDISHWLLEVDKLKQSECDHK